MEIRYQLFMEENLLVQKFIGDFSIQFYKENVAKIYKNIDVEKVKKVLIDFRDVSPSPVDAFAIKGNVEKMIAFRKKIQKEKLPKHDVKRVMWVIDPVQTVVMHLFTSAFEKDKYKYCTTEAKVIDFLSINTDFDLSNKIDQLNNVITNQ